MEKQDWANPTPAGLVALAVVCVCFFASYMKLISLDALPLLGCWMIGGFVIQFTVSIVDLKNRNLPGGNTFLFFSAFFMLTTGLELFWKYYAIKNGIGIDVNVDGYAWAVLSIVLILWTPAFFVPSFSLLSVMVLLLDVALPLIALKDFGLLPAGLVPVPAYLLLLTGIIGIYFSAALVVNGTYGKVIYPLPGQPRTK